MLYLLNRKILGEIAVPNPYFSASNLVNKAGNGEPKPLLPMARLMKGLEDSPTDGTNSDSDPLGSE